MAITLSKDALLIASRQELIDSILSLQQQLQQAQSRLEESEFKLDWFKRQIFGTKSERFIPDSDMQTMLELDVVNKDDQQRQQEKVRITYERKTGTSKDDRMRSGHGRGPMPTHLPIDEETVQPEGDLTGMVRIGEEISWYYEIEKSSLRVKKIIRPKYARPQGEGVVVATLPALPVEKGNAGPGLMTQIAIDKYVYHMPLDRQRKKFENETGVKFSESWLSDNIKNVAFWITPVYEAHIPLLIKRTYLQADETPIPVLIRDKRGKTHRGYFWLYYDPLGKILIFDYRENRSARGPLDFLRDFRGVLQVDAYDGYNEVITRFDLDRAACMDHVRRRFQQALSYDQQRAMYAMDTIRPWYQTERKAKEDGVSYEERLARRLESTVPAMQQFKEWLTSQLPTVLPKSPIGTAIGYALNQWPYFKPFMTDGRIELSNILIENGVRPVAIGRNNYLFCGSHEAAKRAAMIYSIVAIAKNHGYDPYVYMKDLLTRLPATQMSQIDQFLLPNWKPLK